MFLLFSFKTGAAHTQKDRKTEKQKEITKKKNIKKAKKTKEIPGDPRIKARCLVLIFSGRRFETYQIADPEGTDWLSDDLLL